VSGYVARGRVDAAAGAAEGINARLFVAAGFCLSGYLPEPHPLVHRAATVGEIVALKANVARFETEVSGLWAMMERLCKELGVSA